MGTWDILILTRARPRDYPCEESLNSRRADIPFLMLKEKAMNVPEVDTLGLHMCSYCPGRSTHWIFSEGLKLKQDWIISRALVIIWSNMHHIKSIPDNILRMSLL